MHPRPSFYKPTLSYRCVINLCNALPLRVLILHLFWNKSFTFPNLCNLSSLAKITAVWFETCLALFLDQQQHCFHWLGRQGPAPLTSSVSATAECRQPKRGREKPLTGLHFLKGAKHELASSWRNAGTDLLILLSLSGWENWLSGREGAVETEEQHVKFRIGHNHRASGTRRKHTWLSFMNAVLYEG